MTVDRLAQPQIARMTSHVADGKLLPTQVLHHIVDKTDGVPLFVEEITKAILESSYLKDIDGRYALPGVARHLRHSSHAPRLAHGATGSPGDGQRYRTICRGDRASVFYELLHAVAHVDEGMLQHELGKLGRGGDCATDAGSTARDL